MDLLDQFDRGTEWTASKLPAAKDQLDQRTPCEQWTVRDLLNHMIETQRYFTTTARGEEAAMPNPSPPSLIGDDPAATYEETRQETLSAYRQPGVLEKSGMGLGIAFVDQMVHGWDLATATGQDAEMPDDLATSAFAMIDGQLTAERRGDAFKPPVDLGDGASAQEKLLAYTGRRT
ncbi:MAG TPA: TIGR03086 family metal-binding protein [Acidimicrobiales bacterium]|jgi:uncharacterized protein (TIGR03086 family)